MEKKFTDEQCKEIRMKLKSGSKLADLAKEYDCSVSTISNVNRDVRKIILDVNNTFYETLDAIAYNTSKLSLNKFIIMKLNQISNSTSSEMKVKRL